MLGFLKIKKRPTMFEKLIIMLAICASPCAYSKNIYTYEDSQGRLLLTDKQQSKNGKIIKITTFPDSNIHSYENWGGSNQVWVKKYAKNHAKFDNLIQISALKHGVDPILIKAVIHTESAFNSRAISPVGAQGLMQLMPATAKRFKVTDSFDPAQNIEGGTRYLNWLSKRFNGNQSLILAAYNAGEGNVDKYKGIPPFKETQQYVKKVQASYQKTTTGKNTTTDNTSSKYTYSKSHKPIHELKIIKKDNSFGDEFSTL